MTRDSDAQRVETQVKLGVYPDGSVRTSLRCHPRISYAYADAATDLSILDDEQPLSPSSLYNYSPSASPTSTAPSSLPSTAPASAPAAALTYTVPVILASLPRLSSPLPGSLIAVGKSLPASHPLRSDRLTANLARLLPFVASSSPLFPFPETPTVITATANTSASYTGEWYEGELSSCGLTASFPASPFSPVYKGDFSPLTLTGRAELSWADGSVYDGEIVSGRRHGTGVFHHEQLHVAYQGDWQCGLRHGKGRLLYDKTGSSSYDGEWREGERHGRGVMRWSSGTLYEGEWQHDRKHGSGVIVWPQQQQRYSGDFRDDRPHGVGTFTYFSPPQLSAVGPSPRLSLHHPVHNSYTGEVADGQREGDGSFFYADGSEWHGRWQAGQKQGRGVWVWQNGAEMEADWTDDELQDENDRRRWREQDISLPAVRLRHSILQDAELAAVLQRHDAQLRSLYCTFAAYDPSGQWQDSEGFGCRLNLAQAHAALTACGLLPGSGNRRRADINRLLLYSGVVHPTRRRCLQLTDAHDLQHWLLYRDWLSLLVTIAHDDSDTDGESTLLLHQRVDNFLTAHLPASISLPAPLLYQLPVFRSVMADYEKSTAEAWTTVSTPSLAAHGQRYTDRTANVSGMLPLLSSVLSTRHFSMPHLLHLLQSPRGHFHLDLLYEEYTYAEFVDFLLQLAIYRAQLQRQQALTAQQRQTEREDRERERRQQQAVWRQQQLMEHEAQARAAALQAAEAEAAAAAAKKHPSRKSTPAGKPLPRNVKTPLPAVAVETAVQSAEELMAAAAEQSESQLLIADLLDQMIGTVEEETEAAATMAAVSWEVGSEQELVWLCAAVRSFLSLLFPQ